MRQLLRASSEKNFSVSTGLKHLRAEDSSDEEEDEEDEDEDDEDKCFISAKRYGKRAKLTDHMVPREHLA